MWSDSEVDVIGTGAINLDVRMRTVEKLLRFSLSLLFAYKIMVPVVKEFCRDMDC
jgi:hypothetical protein